MRLTVNARAFVDAGFVDVQAGELFADNNEHNINEQLVFYNGERTTMYIGLGAVLVILLILLLVGVLR